MHIFKGRKFRSLSRFKSYKAIEQKNISFLVIPLMFEHFPQRFLKLMNSFRRIVFFLNASSLSRQDLSILLQYENEFMSLYHSEFSGYDVVAKVHRVMHYEKAIEYLGDAVNFSCFPFEAFLSYLNHGTHATKINIYELNFISRLNTNLDVYIDAVDGDSSIFPSVKDKEVDIGCYKLCKEIERNEHHSNDCRYFEVVKDQEKEVIYNVYDNKARTNNLIVFYDDNEIEYGKILQILLKDESILLYVKRYKVYKKPDTNMDDLFLYSNKDWYDMIHINIENIVCKFICVYLENDEWFIVSNIHKEFI